MSAVIATLFSLRTVFERNRVERELADSATEILERITRETRYASASGVGSIFDTSPGVLALDQDATSTRIYLSGNDLYVEQNSVAIGPLNNDDVSVDSLVFTAYTQATSTAIRTALTLSVASPYATQSETFYVTTLLRGSYDE